MWVITLTCWLIYPKKRCLLKASINNLSTLATRITLGLSVAAGKAAAVGHCWAGAF